MTKKICKAYAWAIAKRSGRHLSINKEKGPSNKWWCGFIKRNPTLSLRRADKLDRGRARMANQTVMNQHFDLLNQVFTKLGLKDKVMNCDESRISLDPKKEKVIASKGTKHVYSQQLGTRDHITIHCCISASGESLPPMIIYQKNFPSGAYTRGGPPNTLYAKSPNGYMDSELYLLRFKRIFLKYAPKERPLLLIQDGYKSHITIDLIDEARENDVEILCLPPHTAHILQPLDKVLYGPFKTRWKQGTSWGNTSLYRTFNDSFGSRT